jgi:DNA polymerase I
MPEPSFPESPVFLVDGDALVFRYAVANQREVEWYEGISTAFADFASMVGQVVHYLESINATPGNTLVMFSGDRELNFRKALFPDYKKSRTHRKPQGYRAAMDLLSESYHCLASPCLEADDLLGIFATHPALSESAIIVAQDKDLKTVPGWHLDPFALEDGKFFWISRHESDCFLYLQALCGDSTDGYPGCPGVGAVKAQALVDKTPDWSHVLKAFKAVKGPKKAEDPEAEALTQIRLARILQYDDVDWATGTIKLWEPEVER